MSIHLWFADLDTFHRAILYVLAYMALMASVSFAPNFDHIDCNIE